MTYIGIIQSRMSSTRLPGKVLLPLAGKPLLQHLADALDQSVLANRFVIATSSEPSDDSIAAYCATHDIACVRGALANVAQRYQTVLAQYPAAAFVRICGDSPLVNISIVERAIQLHQHGTSDIVTNTLERSYPKGLSVEVVTADLFQANIAAFDAQDQEHVTRYFYRNSAAFNIENFTSGLAAGDLQLSVDTQQDYNILNAFLATIADPVGRLDVTDLVARYQAFLETYHD